MTEYIRFKENVYAYLRQVSRVPVFRSRVFRLSNKIDQKDYQHIINHFKKWVFYIKPYTFENEKLNEIYLDFDRLLTEYSNQYGIKSGEVMLSEGELKARSKTLMKSLESIIEDSLKDLDKNIENTSDTLYTDFIHNVQSGWNKSFMINCIPNVLNGNYINIPTNMIEEKSIESVATFLNSEDFFFSYLGILPLKFNRVVIDEVEYVNIINTSIVPMFITLEKDYTLERI